MAATDKINKIFDDASYIEKFISREKLLDYETKIETPFESDGEYIDHLKSTFMLRSVSLQMALDMKQKITGLYNADAREKFDFNESLVQNIRRLIEIVDGSFRKRIELMKNKHGAPRILRLAEKINLSWTHLGILHYYILLYGDCIFSERFNLIRNQELKNVALFLELDLEDIMEFINSESPLIKHGLLELESSKSSLRRGIFEREINMREEVIMPLMGLPVTEEMLIKIDGTVVAEILKEEPGAIRIQPQKMYLPKSDFKTESYNDTNGCDDIGDINNGEYDSTVGDDDVPDENDFDLGDFLKKDKETESGPLRDEILLDDEDSLSPYASDLQYIEDMLMCLLNTLMFKKIMVSDSLLSLDFDDERSREVKLRELRAKEKALGNIIDARMAKTRLKSDWLPRLERLCDSRRYDYFEKNIILMLIGSRNSTEFRKQDFNDFNIGEIITALSSGFRYEIENRKYFYKNARLVRDGIITIQDFDDIKRAGVEIDRRMMDYLLGIDTEINEFIEGSHLYTPNVKLGQVILPDAQKEIIMKHVENFHKFQNAKKKLGFNEIISYGSSMVMLFYGPSGTGKTMLANAIANHLGKKILLVNFPSLGGMVSDLVIKYIFREAKVNNAILFFDECEEIFKSRGMGNSAMTLLLSEFEKLDGLIILATNMPQVMDEAMQRRITMSFEFRKPDHQMRKKIWHIHLNSKVKLSDDVDLNRIAYDYELSGGLIKNAVLTALSNSVSRSGDPIIINQGDLEDGARKQLKRFFQSNELEKKIIPSVGLQGLVLEEGIKNRLVEIIQYEKSKNVLFGQWGFDDDEYQYRSGTSILMHGMPGTGKTLAAECMAYELGRPVRLVNAAQVVSKWVGDTAKNMESIFNDAADTESILLFDEADALFAGRTAVESSNDRYANADVNILLQGIERYKGMVILTTNLIGNIDEAFFRRLKYNIEFTMPDESLRELLWKRLLPDRLPLEEGIDFRSLARDFKLTGGNIKNAIFRASIKASQRTAKYRVVKEKDLRISASEELSHMALKKIGF